MRLNTPLSILLTSVLVVIIGLALAGMGGWLVALGGSPYYVVAGLGLLLSGVLMGRQKRVGAWVYTTVLAGTLIWAIWEVGADGWSLIPRLIAPAVLGLWIWSPWIAGRLGPGQGRRGWRWANAGFSTIIVVLVFAAGYRITESRYLSFAPPSGWDSKAVQTEPAVPDDAWSYYGRTPAADRYSPLSQITAANVSELKQAWSFSTGDLPRPGENKGGHEFSFEATPIKVGDAIYFCTPHRDVIALDATSGKQKWRYSPGGDMSHNVYQACRGVSYFEAPAESPCPHRIVATASDLPRLFEIDADTGKLCDSFGDHGMVDLREHMGIVPAGFHFISSPPTVINGRAILGGWVYDNQAVGEPSGVIRAFDATSGALSWSWDMGRTPANAPLGRNDIYTRGTPNGWGVYSADPKLNLVFVPLGNATPDYYGAERRSFDDAYSSSLVALDITTGQERWHFQTVHHDLWDFDVPVGPSLVDLPGQDGGGPVPALVQTTKQGEIYLLDRRDGRPIAPVEERAVPQGDIPNERYSKTQPFSVGMPALRAPKFQEVDAWGATPIDQLICRLQYRQMRDDGLYTPPGLKPTLGWPAFDGTSDWYGSTIDPVRKLMYINTTFMPFRLQMIPYEKGIQKGLYKPWGGWGQPYPQSEFSNNPQHGTPFAITVDAWLNILNLPCSRPPWGQMQAIDLVTHKVVWQRPLGTTRNMGPFGVRIPFGLPTGIFSMGGSVTTASGLVFIGATTDQDIRALDGRTGKTLWQADLPAGGNATPLTYLGKDGRQYVVIAAGGHGGLQSRNGDKIVAFALPNMP